MRLEKMKYCERTEDEPTECDQESQRWLSKEVALGYNPHAGIEWEVGFARKKEQTLKGPGSELRHFP